MSDIIRGIAAQLVPQGGATVGVTTQIFLLSDVKLLSHQLGGHKEYASALQDLLYIIPVH